MQKPKLLFFINTLNFGGAERVVSQLLTHLNDTYELHLALYSRFIKYDIPEEVKVFSLEEDVMASNSSALLRLPILAKKLTAYCKQEKIETCVAFLNRPCYILALMRALFGFKGKLIMCERSHRSSIINFIGSGSSFAKKIAYLLTKYSYKWAHLIIANSKVSKEDLVKNFAVSKPIKVIYNPIDIKTTLQKAEEPLEENIDPNYFYFVSTGNFRPEKNFALLLEAFALIKDLPVKLFLVGGGELEQELRTLTQNLVIENRVIFTGFQNNPYKYIKNSNCFVLSSYTEGFPNVLLEALACGKPVIATDCLSGPRELLAPATPINKVALEAFEEVEFGLLSPLNKASILAEAMKEMFQNKELLKSYEIKAFKRAAEFDINKVKEQFIKAFSI